MLVTEFGITVFIHPTINVFVFVSIIALQLPRESYFGFPESTSIVVRPEQYQNASLPMLVTELGMVTLVRPEQPENALSLMLVTEFGITVFLHPTINVFVFVSIIALHLSRESYFVFPDSTFIDVKSEQPEKAYFPMLVTELPIVTLVRPEQPEKAERPMLVTEFGMVTLVRPEQW